MATTSKAYQSPLPQNGWRHQYVFADNQTEWSRLTCGSRRRVGIGLQLHIAHALAETLPRISHITVVGRLTMVLSTSGNMVWSVLDTSRTKHIREFVMASIFLLSVARSELHQLFLFLPDAKAFPLVISRFISDLKRRGWQWKSFAAGITDCVFRTVVCAPILALYTDNTTAVSSLRQCWFLK